MRDPIKLLGSYTEEDNDVLFGRDVEKQALLGLVSRYPIVVLSGESGTGKTSLLRAGVIPSLVRHSTPFSAGFDEPVIAVYQRLERENLGSASRKIADSCGIEAGEAADMAGVFALLPERVKALGKKLVVVLDQCEEFLVYEEEAHRLFPSRLLTDLFRFEGVKLVFCLRSDYLPLFMSWLSSSRLLFDSEQFYYIRRFDSEKSLDVFKKCLDLCGMEDDGVSAGRIISVLSELDVEGLVFPPHIQIVLSALRKGYRENGSILREMGAYDRPGVERILSGFFNEELFRGFDSKARATVKKLMDTLVGREGLRRKLSAEDLARRLGASAPEVSRLSDALVQRRIVRRLDDGRFELIHDFLSRHFFESFSTHERKARKMQDMFQSALLDFRDSGILLDERRLRIFLHNRDLLSLDLESRLFIIRSIMQIYTFGTSPYIDLSMKADIFSLLETEVDAEMKKNLAHNMPNLAGYPDAKLLIKLFKAESEPSSFKSALFTLISELDTGWAMGALPEMLSSWKYSGEQFIEDLIRDSHKASSKEVTGLLHSILASAKSENLLLAAIDALETIHDPDSMDIICDLLEKKSFKIARVLDRAIMVIERELSLRKAGKARDGLSVRFDEILKTAAAGKTGASLPAVYEAYVRRFAPGIDEVIELFKSTSDTYNQQAILRAIGDSQDERYMGALKSLYADSGDPVLSESISEAITHIETEGKEAMLIELFNAAPQERQRNYFLQELSRIESEAALDICRGILKSSNLLSGDLPFTAINCLGRMGDESDFSLIKSLYEKADSQAMRIFILDSICGFTGIDETGAGEFAQRVFDATEDDELKIKAACCLYRLGSSRSYQYLIDRISRFDEKFPRTQGQVFFSSLPGYPIQILFTLLETERAMPDEGLAERVLRDFIANAANRDAAGMAEILYAAKLLHVPEARGFLEKTAQAANRPDNRGLALLGLAGTGKEEYEDLIRRTIVSSDYPIERRIVIYALCACDPDFRNGDKSIRFIADLIASEAQLDIVRHSIYAFGRYARKEDVPLLDAFIQNERKTRVDREIVTRRLAGTKDYILDYDRNARILPPLKYFFGPELYDWRMSLGLNIIQFY